MPGRRRKLALALLVVVIAAIAVAANVDHRWKTRSINRAELAQWYCVHRGTQCGGDDPERLEQLWTWREYGYKGAVAVLFTGSLVLAASVVRRRA